MVAVNLHLPENLPLFEAFCRMMKRMTTNFLAVCSDPEIDYHLDLVHLENQCLWHSGSSCSS
jgi:hypothetical protein